MVDALAYLGFESFVLLDKAEPEFKKLVLVALLVRTKSECLFAVRPS